MGNSVLFAGRAVLAVVVGCALPLAACCPASALDSAQICQRSKLKAATAAGARLLRCEERFAGTDGVADRLRCQDRVRAALRTRLNAADATALDSGFSCPATPESLSLEGAASWPERVTEDLASNGAVGSSCTRQRLAAVRRYASAYSHCRISLPDAPLEDVSECAEDARDDLTRTWSDISERTVECSNLVLPQLLAARIDQEVEAQAQRLRVRCGDGRVAGFEECDDGGSADDDRCTNDCRLQQCERVQGGQVQCAVCPEDAMLDPATGVCRCPDGFAGDPGDCSDIDECAADDGGCPADRPCVNLAATHACAIPCTAEAFHEALASCGAPTGAIAFDCKNKVIELERSFVDDPRLVTCSDLVIDGAGSKVTFQMDPLCWRIQITQDRCRTPLEPDGTCACPDIDTGAPFLILDGNRNTVRNLTVRGFFDGIRAQGSANLVENVRFERMCDDAFGSVGAGTANVFRDLAAFDGCDKCSESDGDLASTDPDHRVPGHYSAIFENISFEGCLTPVRLSKGGRFLIRGAIMGPSADPAFPCDGPRFSGMTDDEVAVEMQSSVVTGCRRGVRFGILADGVLSDNIIRDNALRGVRVAGDARVSMWGNDIRRNGGEGSSEAGFGGVAVVGQGQVDLGGGDLEIDGQEVVSRGGNAICDNYGPDGVRRDLDNGTGAAAPAEENWWCTPDSPADRVVGPADFLPFLRRAP